MYNKLFSKILDSSIWLEDDHTRLVWITFLAVMDQDGMVALSGIGNVALRARVTEEQAADAIKCLEGPDEKNPDQDNEGRRIERIAGVGWFVLNAAKYRDIIKAEDARAATRERVRRHRAKCNADVTVRNESVTPSDSDSDSDSDPLEEKTEPEKQKHRKPPSLPKKIEDEINIWLDATAPLTGAKDRRTIASPRKWRDAIERAIKEQNSIEVWLGVVKSEAARNKGTPQFFSPESCLKILHAKKIKSNNGFFH